MALAKLTLAAGIAAVLSLPAAAQTLRIGLNEDADLLDPHQAQTYVGRIVFAGLCDKLVDYTPDLKFVPQLATSWEYGPDNKSLTLHLRPGVTFHDGEKLDAEAVKYNFNRMQTLPTSRRKAEISAVAGVEVVDPLTVKLVLKAPFAPLLSQLADRAGMMVSPKAAEALGAAGFGAKPVCTGPFRFAERVAQDRIVLERYPGYWNKDQIFLDKVVYRPIPDTTVKLANLEAGSLDLIERTAPSDVAKIKQNPKLTLIQITGLGYNGITVNTNHGPRADNPLGRDKRLREAFELALDRDALNQVVFEGAYTANNQYVAPTNPFYTKSLPMPPRDVAKAKALVKAAGFDHVPVELLLANDSLIQQLGQLIQSMAAEAGFDVKLVSTEFATMLDVQDRGDFQATILGWSGRVDPDGNIYNFVHSGAPLNIARYSNGQVDKLLDDARQTTDLEARQQLYDKANTILHDELPLIYLYNDNRIFTLSTKVTGFVANPDGLIRLAGVKLQ